MLRLVIPKGSLEEQTLALLEAADLRVRRGSSRDYHGRIEDDRIDRVSLLRPQEIPRYVEEGFFDLGITGRDWVVETGARVEVLASLEYAKSGAGEVLLTSIDRDGTGQGYDLELLRAVGEAIHVPLVASGGAGSLEHFAEALSEGRTDAVLAASRFHFEQITLAEVKAFLAERGIPVRPA